MATVPTEPLIVVRPKCTSQTLEFYWRPPVSDGGSAITGFTLTDGTLTYNITGNPGYYKVTGLTNGQTYSFTLAAVNGVGTGPAASFRSVEPGNKPQPPASVSYTDQGSGNVLVNWTNPADIGGTSRLLGMLVRSFRVDTNSNINLSSFSTVNSIWGGNASSSYSFPFRSLSTTNNWQFQIQLQNDPGRTLRTLGFTSTFIASLPDFSPSSILSLQMWLDGNDPAATGVKPSNGASITTWVDKSGFSINGSNGVAGTYSLADSGISFNGTSTYYSTTITTNPSNETVLIAFKYKGNNGAAWFDMLGSGANNGRNLTVRGDNRAIVYDVWGVGAKTSTPTLVVTSNVMAMTTGFISSGFARINVNGSNYSVGASMGTSGSGQTLIGKSQSGDYFNGTIHEILYYSTPLLTLNQQTAEGYLAWKWGISTLLPSWHPFYYRKPLVTDSNLDFSPSSLGGTQVWLDAADTTTIVRSGSTSTIVTWTDKSGLSNSATSVNNPQYLPTDNSIVFNGTNQYFTLPNGALPFSNSSYSYYFVAQFSNTNAGGVIGGGSATNNSSYNIRPDNGNIRNYWYFNDIVTTNIFTPNTRAAITSYYSTASTRSLSLNYQSTVSDTPTARTQTNTNNTIGRTVANEYLSGRIHEVLVFSTMHSAVDRQRIEGYLAWKWGNQSFLPPSHLYYYRPPTRLDTFSTVGTSTILGPIASTIS